MSVYIVCELNEFSPLDKIENALNNFYEELAKDPDPEPRFLLQIERMEQLLKDAREIQKEFDELEKARELREKGKK